MLSTLFLTLVVSPRPIAPAVLVPTIQEEGAEFEAKMSEAGDDVAKLWELHLWCRENSKYSESRQVLKKIVELDSEHQEARKALGHHYYDNQWFETYTALAKHKRTEEAEMEAKGLARFGDGWAPIADIPFLRMQWEKDDSGTWVNPHKKARSEERAKLEEEGWKLQDMTWISPDEQTKIEEGLFKCGDQWLALAEANTFHSTPYQWWTIPGERFVVWSTCDRKIAEFAIQWADVTYATLASLYGMQPDEKPPVTVLRSLAQYNTFAAGDQNLGLPAAEGTGASSCHYAFFGEAMVDGRSQPPEYRGQGVAYWDVADPKLEPFGPLSIKHAAALSYAEAIDPSWDTISKIIANPASAQGGIPATFWTEKKIPAWIRYGIASYVERYAPDPGKAEGEGRWGLRNWAFSEVKRKGGLRELDVVFTLQLDPADQEGSSRLISEAGCLVSFVVDGRIPDVTEKHAAFKAALRGGDKAACDAAVVALQDAIKAYEDELKLYAGL